MSLAILTQVYDEMRRLAIAGSVTAVGDFRLKKLLPALEQAGAKAPVFARVAEAVKAVVDGTEQSSAPALLDLTGLVNAILYTQGETAAPGTLQPIATNELATSMSQAGARVLKPLRDALTTTGPGRLELIKDAHERDGFRDLRLVKPALDALDDPYGEVADFVADNVLPIYGVAIVPELRARFDLKGGVGHARRLRLLHGLDPAKTRTLVKAALDVGSKEVKVVAVECLGGESEDLSYLIEQASAKSQDVRQAAYRALAILNDDAAVAVLEKALTGKDLAVAALSLRKSRSAKLLRFIIAGADQELASVADMKDKKEIGQRLQRLRILLGCLYGRDDSDTAAFILKLFGKRTELAKIKGADLSGADLNQDIVHLMQQGTNRLQQSLAEAHASLSVEELACAFNAARQVLPVDTVFDAFSPYITAKVDEKKKQRDGAWAKREAICEAIGGRRYGGIRQDAAAGQYDPRWLDLAVKLKHLGMIRQLGRPDHAGAAAFLQETFDAVLKKSKSLEECHEVLTAMVYSSHTGATDALLACIDKHGKDKKSYCYGSWIAHLIPALPKTAIPKIEAVVPTLPNNLADSIVGYLQQLRDKT